MYTVYKHTSPNGKVYIGITSLDVKVRWGNSGQGYKEQYFYKAIEKYGWENITHEIICTVETVEEAEKLEISFIEKYRSTDKKYGYNIDIGGKFHSIETRKKISESHKGKKLSEETKKKLREANLGKTHTADSRRKIKEHSARYWLGKQMSEETKRKISESKKGKPTNRVNVRLCGSDNHKSKSVMCIETSEIFECIAEAERKYNCVHIGMACMGQRKTAGGYHWKYIDKQQSVS